MGKRDAMGVKRNSGGLPRGPAVFAISENGMIAMRELDANLMLSAGEQANRDQGQALMSRNPAEFQRGLLASRPRTDLDSVRCIVVPEFVIKASVLRKPCSREQVEVAIVDSS